MIRRWAITVVGVLNLLFLDQLAKQAAVVHLKGGYGISVLSGLFDLAYVENRGCAWGMFQGQAWPLAVFALLALAFLVWKREAVFGSSMLAPILLYAGIVGNLLDRLARGCVVDFLDFHWGVHHFPCFNLADSFICIAAALLILNEAKGLFARGSHRER